MNFAAALRPVLDPKSLKKKWYEVYYLGTRMSAAKALATA
jgi:hypothetical protein